jgi:hypothetical protein
MKARSYWLIALACVVGIGGAQAQESQCGPHDKVVSLLAQRLQEIPAGLGTIDAAHIIELFLSATGSWTMVVTNTDKVSCVFAAGENFVFDTSAFDGAEKGEPM